MRINNRRASALTPTVLGEVAAIYRYPVKSMRGESVEAASLGWHGLEGDRRLALASWTIAAAFPG
jgi:hypothetical protein